MALEHIQWPSTPVPDPIKQLLARFFTVGDSKADDAGQILGSEIFMSDGQIVVNKKVINGAEGQLIVECRARKTDTYPEIASSNHGLLQGLESRRHEISKVYSCNDAGDDLVLTGEVFWTFKDGSVRSAGFAARAVVGHVGDGRPRLKLYQGWTVRKASGLTTRNLLCTGSV